MILVTLAQAKHHLRIALEDVTRDVDINMKLEQATAIVVKHLKSQADPLWTPLTVPKPVHAAVLCILEDLYEHRLINKEQVAILLTPHRDPALA